MMYAKHESDRCGSDWTCICRDLKTIRGVQNRITRGRWPAGTWRIYNCHDSDWYKATGHFLVGKLHKAKTLPPNPQRSNQMSQFAKDIRETLSMLERLTDLLANNANRQRDEYWNGRARTDAQALRRISMTLHRWHELECNGDIQRLEEKGNKPYWRGYPIPDREAGARKRLAKIMANYPGLTSYVQGDPRGCALYILPKADVPAGASIDSCYSRGLAVFK